MVHAEFVPEAEHDVSVTFALMQAQNEVDEVFNKQVTYTFVQPSNPWRYNNAKTGNTKRRSSGT
jgi:hypothetical protein